MNETVRRFLPMVDFLEQVLGKNSEIVLHDFSDPDHAIVDIRNGIVSGRKVGGPATDLALKIMHDGKYRDLPFITGYEGRGAGGKTLESATYFIREDGEIVGMLCVNTDLSAVRNISAMAQQLMACFDAAPARTEPSPIEVESLSESTQELIDKGVPFDGVIGLNDQLAIGALTVMRANGIEIPRQVQVIGFDNIEESQYLQIPLTTMDSRLEWTAPTAVERILGRIRGEIAKPELLMTDCDVIVRDSTR